MSAQPQALWQFERMASGDLGAILDVERRSYEFPWSEGIFSDCLKSGYEAWLLRGAAGEVLAYRISTMAVGEVHLLNLCVAPEMRGQGFARCMLDHLLAQARAEHMTQVLLEVRKSNKTAIALYERYGFERLGLRKGYYPASAGREDAIVMGLQLT